MFPRRLARWRCALGAFIIFVVVNLEFYVYVCMRIQKFFEFTVPNPKGGIFFKKETTLILSTPNPKGGGTNT